MPCLAHSCHELDISPDGDNGWGWLRLRGAGWEQQWAWGGLGMEEAVWGSRLLLAPHLQGPVDDVSHNQKHHSVL